MCGFHVTMIVMSTIAVGLIIWGTYCDAELFFPMLLASVVVVGMFGYLLFGSTTVCKTNIVKQCEIVTSMYNEQAATVVYKDISDKEASIVDNTIRGVGIVKSGHFQLICTYDVNHYGDAIQNRTKYVIVDTKAEK